MNLRVPAQVSQVAHLPSHHQFEHSGRRDPRFEIGERRELTFDLIGRGKRNEDISLGERAKSAVIWNTGFNLFRDLLQFGVMLVLVRLLEPEVYGEFGLVTSVIGFISIFSFSQFIAHALQVRDESALDYQSHFTAGAVIMVSLCGVTNLVAVAFRWLPAYARVAPLVHVMSLTFLLEWPCEFRRKMLEREYDWKRLRLLHGSGLGFSSIVGVVMASQGTRVYALLVPGLIVTLPFIFDLFWGLHWKPDWSWSWPNYKAAWHFGLTRIGSGIATNGRQLVESATLVKVLGYAPLGVLNRSLGLTQMFCQKFAAQLLYSIYPVLTRLNPENTARVNGLVLRIVAWVAFPVAAIFIVLASPVVRTVYGRQWVGVISLLPWTMLGGVTIALAQTTNGLLLAQQQQTRCLIADLFVFVGTVAMLLLALPMGVKPYLVGIVAVQLAALFVMIVWLCWLKALRSDGIAYAVVPPLVSAGAAYLACELARASLGADDSRFSTAVLYGTGFASFYVGALRLLFSRTLDEIVFYLPGRATIGRILVLKSTA